MKVAALQMVSEMDLDTNLRAADRLLQEAALQGAELAGLPEYFCILGQRDTDKLALAEAPGSGVIQTFLADAARRYGLWILGGTLPMATNTPARVHNSSLLFSPQGVLHARYDKIHLFNFDNGIEHYDEARVLEPGLSPVCCELPSLDGHRWRLGLSVCYDLRFPELYQTLQADLIAVPSAFTFTTGQAHWELLLRARAIENLAYVMAPAQGGQHANGRTTWGHTMLVDSWGSILQELPVGEGVVCAELSYAAMQKRRQQLPAMAHRKKLGNVCPSV